MQLLSQDSIGEGDGLECGGAPSLEVTHRLMWSPSRIKAPLTKKESAVYEKIDGDTLRRRIM